MFKNRFITCILIILFLFLLNPASAVQADLTAQETDLATDGQAWEANLDSQGMLWVSHTYPSEIWRIDTQAGGITRYLVGGQPSDGRGDGSGNLWWADISSNHLGRLNTVTNQVNIWLTPGGASLYTTAIDTQGKIWATEFHGSSLYRLDPATNQLCVYTLPDGGWVNYLAVEGNYLWLGDSTNARIIRLDALGGGYDWWQLPESSFPVDLVLDGSSSLWWTDPILNQIGRLEPAQDRITVYPFPPSGSPQMLNVKDGQVWFSFWNADIGGGVGRLDPLTAAGTVSILTRISQAASSACQELAPSITGTVTSIDMQPNWGDKGYAVQYNQDGWLTFQSPENGLPYGIAAGAQVWLVDNGRSKLARLSYPAQVKACVRLDADGNPATPGDQTPTADWPVYLRIAGIRQTPDKLTGPDGCATWIGLQPGPEYGVEEDTSGVVALTPTSHDFGASIAGQSYQYTFINMVGSRSTYMPLVLKH